MNVQEFLNETLVQISKGVEEAQKELAETGGRVNPDISTGQGVFQQKGEFVTRQG